MTEEQLDYRFKRILALAYFGEMLGNDVEFTDEQVDNLIQWTEAVSEEFENDEEVANKMRELAHQMYAELSVDFEKGGGTNK